jgi:hypothetical protein
MLLCQNFIIVSRKPTIDKKAPYGAQARERVNPLPPGEKPHIGDYFHFEITFGKRGVCAN